MLTATWWGLQTSMQTRPLTSSSDQVWSCPRPILPIISSPLTPLSLCEGEGSLGGNYSAYLWNRDKDKFHPHPLNIQYVAPSGTLHTFLPLLRSLSLPQECHYGGIFSSGRP